MQNDKPIPYTRKDWGLCFADATWVIGSMVAAGLFADRIRKRDGERGRGRG